MSKRTLMTPALMKKAVILTQWPGISGSHNFLIGVHSKMRVSVVAMIEAVANPAKAIKRMRNFGVGKIRR